MKQAWKLDTLMEEVEILLVEDNPYDTELIMDALLDLDVTEIKIRKCKDGKEAIDYFFGKQGIIHHASFCPPKLIILDLKLPHIDGFELLRQLKANKYTFNVPVVIFTSSYLQKDRETCYGLGANSYIVKCLDAQKFAQDVCHIGYYWTSLNKTPYDDHYPSGDKSL